MTIKKAISILYDMYNYYNDKDQDSYVGFDNDDKEALKIAIKNLENELSYEDCRKY